MGRSARDISLHDVAYVLFKRRHSILGVFAVVLAGVAVALLLSPRGWDASATLLLKRERGETLISPQPSVAVPSSARMQLDQDVRSEAELVKRRSVLAKVVEAIGPQNVLKGTLPGSGGPAQAPDGLEALLRRARQAVDTVVSPVSTAVTTLLARLNTKEPMSIRDQAIAALDGRTKVTAVENSNLVKVAFAAEDGRYAARVVDLMMKTYLEEYARLRTSPGTTEFFRAEMERLGRELGAAEAKAEAFGQAHGVTPLNRQREMYLTAAFEHETTQRATEAEVRGLREKRRALREQLQGMPERLQTEQESRLNPSMDRMRAKMLDLEADRNKLLQKYMDGDRRITDVDKELAALRERALAEPAWEVAKTIVGENKFRQQVLAELVNTDTQLARSEIKARALEADRKAMTDKLLKIDRSLYQRVRQDRVIKTLEDAYLLYAKKYEEARINTALDDERILNVTLAEPVQVAPKPGRALQLGALGVVAGLVLGIGVAFGREFFNNSFTTVESVRRHLRLPVLTTIPDRAR